VWIADCVSTQSMSGEVSRRGGRLARIADGIIDNSVLLIVGAMAGLVWANTSEEGYKAFAHALHYPVNDVGMAFFFALAAKEVVEAVLPGGPLSAPRRAAAPMLAAVGGMAGPAVLFVGLAYWSGERELVRGWAIPCATDIAFSALVARLVLGPGHPAVPFLLLLAIADDAMGMVILAAAYPTGPVRPLEFAAILAAALALAWLLRRRGIESFWPYILGAGAVSWLAFFRGGLHEALALVPIVPFIPHGSSDAGINAEAEERADDPLNRFEHRLRVPVQCILFCFGLVNAGVSLSSVGPGTWIVLVGLLVGKPLGILGFTWVGVAFGLKRPAGVGWHDVIVVGMAAAIGFTVSLFFATAAFRDARLLDASKMGALLSISAAGLAALLAWLLRAGRWSRQKREQAA